MKYTSPAGELKRAERGIQRQIQRSEETLPHASDLHHQAVEPNASRPRRPSGPQGRFSMPGRRGGGPGTG